MISMADSLARRITWPQEAKDALGPGAWQNEPDGEVWTDDATGYLCVIRRSETSGSLCGYVAIPEGHPWHGRHYHDLDARVHGGLTFSRPAAASELHEAYWLTGFDCGHAFDLSPAFEALSRDPGMTYRTIAYAREQCAGLAAQAAAAAKAGD